MQARPAAIIVALFLAQMAATFESAMLFAALPKLIGDFGDPITATWLVTSHMLIGAVACIIAGRLGDMQGRKRVMLVLLALSTVGSVVSALSSQFAVVLVGRALQGLSVAVMPLTMGVLRESLPAQRLPVAVGLMTTASGAGVASGLVLGGAIVDHLNWHWLFAASAALLVLALAAVAALVPARPGTPPREPIDWIEGILPAPGIAGVLLGVSLSKEFGWLDARVWGLVAAGLVVLAIWARRSLRSREPFIDLRLLGLRSVAGANGAAVLMGLGTAQSVLLFSTYMQAPRWTMVGLGFSATVAGLVKLPSNFLSFFAGPLSGWLMQKRGSRLPMMAGASLAGVGWLVALLLPGTVPQMIVLLCVISFGTSVLNAAIPNAIVAAVPESRTSEAMGTTMVVMGLAGAIGAQIVAVLLASDTILAPDGGAAFPSVGGFRLTMMWIAALTFGAAACGLLLSPRRPLPEPAPAGAG